MEPTKQTKCITPFSCLQIAKEYEMVEAKDKNFVFSPLSIQLALSLLTNGSSGSTKTELLSFLRAENLDDLNSSYVQLLDILCQTTKGDSVVSVVGGVWIDESLLLKPSFITNATKIYKAKIETVDFKNEVKAKEVTEKVNQWAKEATEGLIKSVIPENAFDHRTSHVLANALYFKGRWGEEFYKPLTKDSKFYLLDGNYVRVPFMSSSGDHSISVFDEFKILRLSYEGGYNYKKHISMYIILPNERDGLWSLVEKVGSDASFIEKYVSPHMKQFKVVKFKVPKFKIRYYFDAADALESIGLKMPFSSEASFEEMVEDNCSLPVSKVHHTAHIDINEEGTEAAAVTVIEHWQGCCSRPPPNPPIDFVADHPFMFMIRESRSGALLFMGHVLNPLLE